MREIKDIVIHCADTPNGATHFTPKDIDDWHKQRGFKRQDTYRAAFNPTLFAIGYHYIIGISGAVMTGRQVAEVGAHCIPNEHSIGICLFGRDKFTQAQFDSLKNLLEDLKRTYPKANITGHYQWQSAKTQGKTCPNIDIPKFLENGMVPEAKNLLETV